MTRRNWDHRFRCQVGEHMMLLGLILVVLLLDTVVE